MAFFDFLKDATSEKKAAGKVFSFLERPVVGAGRTVSNTAKYGPGVFATQAVPKVGKVVRDQAVSLARGFARIPETAGRSTVEGVNDVLDVIPGIPKRNESAGSGAVTDPIRKFAYGKDPVQTYQTRTEGNKKVIEGSRFRSAASPLSLLGALLTVGGDLTVGGGAEKAGAGAFVKNLAKAETESAVQSVAKKAGVEISGDVARSLAKTKDPNIVKNILKGESSIPKQVVADVPPPKPITKPVTPEPVVNPQIEVLQNQIKTQKELIQHAPNDTAKAKLNAKATSLIKEKDGLIQGDLKTNQAPNMLPVVHGSDVPVPPPKVVNPLSDLSDAQLMNRNYVSNLQDSQGAGAQLPTTPGNIEDIRAKFQASAKANVADPAAVGKAPVAQDIVSASKPKIKSPAEDILTAGKPQETLPTAKLPGVNDAPILPKKASNTSKAVLSNTGLIAKQGENGKKLAGLIGARRDTEEVLQGAIDRAIPSLKNVKKIKDPVGKEELANLADFVEGKTRATNPEIQKLVDEIHQVMPKLRQRLKDAGEDVGDLGPNYYPHIIDIEKIFKNQENYDGAIKALVGSGRTPKDAQGLLDYIRTKADDGLFVEGVRPPTGSGNVKFSRTANLPLYDKSPEALGKYLSSTAKNIARAENYGPNFEAAKDLLKGIRAEGGDTKAVREAFSISEGAKKFGEGAQKAAGVAQQVQATTKLGLSALTNVTQQANTGIVAGYINQLKGASKLASKEGKDFVAKTGVVSDNVIQNLQKQAGFRGALSKVTAPGFRAIERLNREVSALTGREWANDLAKQASKGDKKALATLTEKLGIKGDIGKELTEAQQIQAGRKLTELSQFKADAQDLPGWTASPGGQVVAQLRKFSYKQQGFVWNQILKPIKESGDFKPLARLLAAIAVVGFPAAKLRDKIQNKKDAGDDKVWREVVNAWQKVGGGGLGTDIISGFIPREGSKLPPDVITSRIIGTIGGPTAGAAYELTKNASNLPSGNAKPLARTGVRSLPVVGATAANTIFPYTGLSDKQNTKLKNMSSRGAPKEQQDAYRQFYLTSKKTSSSRTKASDAINKALEKNDLEGAQKLAEDYNAKYNKAFDKWRSQYKQYSDVTLAKEYKSNKINLTPASVKARLKTIKENR